MITTFSGHWTLNITRQTPKSPNIIMNIFNVLFQSFESKIFIVCLKSQVPLSGNRKWNVPVQIGLFSSFSRWLESLSCLVSSGLLQVASEYSVRQKANVQLLIAVREPPMSVPLPIPRASLGRVFWDIPDIPRSECLEKWNKFFF